MLATIDPGSRHLGLVIGDHATLRAACTLPVDPDNLGLVVDAVLVQLRDHDVARAILESGRIYVPPGMTPQAAAAMAQAMATMACLVDRLEQALSVAGIASERIARASWVARVVGHAARDDAAIRRALAVHLSADDCALLTDAHQRDAAGILVWSRLPALERPPMVATENAIAAAREKHRVSALASARRIKNAKRRAKGEPEIVYRDGPHPSDVAFEKMLAERS